MPANKRPARGFMLEQAGKAETAVGSANGVEVDDSILTVVGKLWQGKAKDQFFRNDGV